MAAALQLARPSRLADAAWSYQIVIDGQPGGKIRNRGWKKIAMAPGEHTLQIRSLHIINRHLRFASQIVTFQISDGEELKFTCHPHPFPQALAQWVSCTRGTPNRWIELITDPSLHNRSSAPPTDRFPGEPVGR